MSAKIDIRISGDKPGAVRTALVSSIRAAVKSSIQAGVADIKKVVPIDTGALRASVVGNVFSGEQQVLGSITMEGYALPLEFGLPPGANGVDIDTLTRWVIRKGLTTNAETARGVATKIASKWEREGRVAKGFLGLSFPGVTPTSLEFGELEPIPGRLVDSILQRASRELAQLELGVFS
jgi:hypothetical protein